MNFHDYNIILVNSSGGKDSQTMLHQIVTEADTQEYPRSQIVVAHADLGEMEWKGTRELAQTQAKTYGLRFEAMKRPQGDLLTHVEQRGMWPSSTTRYCTSDHKRGQVGKIITMLHREWDAQQTVIDWRTLRRVKKPFHVLNCFGFRSQESPARAKKSVFENNKRMTTKSRVVDTWLPIHEMKEDEVWASIKASGVPHHPAYDIGMPRLSCIFCIFAPKAALILAGKHNPELLDRYVEVEAKIGHTFRVDLTLAQVKEAVEADEEVGEMSGAWNM